METTLVQMDGLKRDSFISKIRVSQLNKPYHMQPENNHAKLKRVNIKLPEFKLILVVLK